MDAHDDQLTAAAELLPEAWEQLVLDTVRHMHTSIADRAFSRLPGGTLPRTAHDGIADIVYATLAVATRGARSVLGMLARLSQADRDPQGLADNAAWRQTLAIINGLIGGELEEQHNPLAVPMALRLEHRDLPLDRDLLARAYPDAPRRAVVFVHGLTESDDSWSYRRAERGHTYDDVVAAHGYAPLRLRYNSGRHISHNGRDLSEWLETLHHAWPVPLQQVVLVGHSMGGLVIRAAAEAALQHRHGWPASVPHVVMLGTPHNGAPLERAANAGAWLLAQAPELEPLAQILRRRSHGIKDLRRAALRDADWEGLDPDAWRTTRPNPAGGVGRARVHNVGATLTGKRNHPVSVALGDVLVTWGSATAHGQEWAREANVVHVGASHHFSLLNHREIDLLLDEILTDAPANLAAGS